MDHFSSPGRLTEPRVSPAGLAGIEMAFRGGITIRRLFEPSWKLTFAAFGLVGLGPLTFAYREEGRFACPYHMDWHDEFLHRLPSTCS